MSKVSKLKAKVSKVSRGYRKSVWTANTGVHFEFLVLGSVNVKCSEGYLIKSANIANRGAQELITALAVRSVTSLSRTRSMLQEHTQMELPRLVAGGTLISFQPFIKHLIGIRKV